MPRQMDSQVSPEKLRVLGKQASVKHLRDGVPLTEAVVQVLRDEPSLSVDHVKRVAEYSNNDTFQAMFEKEAGDHRVINFEGGPADPSAVLKELNMSASQSPVTVSQRPGSFSSFIPGQDSVGSLFDMPKVASAETYAMAEPHGDIIRLRTRLNGVRDHFLSKVASLGVCYDEAVMGLYKEARQLILNGVSPAWIATAIDKISSNDDMTKLALKSIRDCAGSEDLPTVPMKKEASGFVNPKHPLVVAYKDFEKVAERRYTFLAAVDIVDAQLQKVSEELRGLLG